MSNIIEAEFLFLHESQDIYYFGCWDGVGHYLWLPGMRHSASGPSVSNILDSKRWQPSRKEGEAKVTHVDGCTILSFADYSVDSRGGSHSTFLIRGTVDFDTALSMAKENFPQVFARFKFEIVEVKNG